MQAEKEELFEIYEQWERLKKSVEKLNEAVQKKIELKMEAQNE